MESEEDLKQVITLTVSLNQSKRGMAHLWLRTLPKLHHAFIHNGPFLPHVAFQARVKNACEYPPSLTCDPWQFVHGAQGFACESCYLRPQTESNDVHLVQRKAFGLQEANESGNEVADNVSVGGSVGVPGKGGQATPVYEDDVEITTSQIGWKWKFCMTRASFMSTLPSRMMLDAVFYF